MELQIIKGAGKFKGKKLSILWTKEPGYIKVPGTLGIPKKHEVTKIEWQQKDTRSGGKAAVGTIAGGVLGGGIGAIAGAAIGGRKKDASMAVLEIDGLEVIVAMTPKEYEKLSSWVNT